MMVIYINCWRLTNTVQFVLYKILAFVFLAWHLQPIFSLPLSLSLVSFVLSDSYIPPLLKFTKNNGFVICISFIIFVILIYRLDYAIIVPPFGDNSCCLIMVFQNLVNVCPLAVSCPASILQK